MKAITIQGAEVDTTIIRDDTSTKAADEPFTVKGVEGKPFMSACATRTVGKRIALLQSIHPTQQSIPMFEGGTHVAGQS